MSELGARTKKVTVYGRKKAQVISVHSDFSPVKPLPQDLTVSPSSPAFRPPLRSKLSSDVSNLPLTPSASQFPDASKVPRDAALKLADTHGAMTGKPRKVNRPNKVVVPRTSPAPATNATVKAKATRAPVNKARREVFDGVVIPSSSAVHRPTADLSDRLASLALHEDTDPTCLHSSAPTTAGQLSELFAACSSSAVHPFVSFFESSTFLQPVFAVHGGPVHIRKIGEASYSEVFAIQAQGSEPEVVVKVIPLVGHENVSVAGHVEMPECSSAADILRELQVTKRMTATPEGGFAHLIGAFAVEGFYPSELLGAWDEYKASAASESFRPDSFSVNQQYILVVLSHGGPDLEAFQFDRSTGWIQAASVFWQVVGSLACAEDWTSFEHRDLHEGQILITKIPVSGESGRTYLDPADSGVKATIIDFGLSRLDMPEGTAWTTLPVDLYDGIGEQWDVYRAMRDHIAGDWKGYHPLTTVMWLHYLIRYLIHSCGLRKPRAQPAKSTRSALSKSDTTALRPSRTVRAGASASAIAMPNPKTGAGGPPRRMPTEAGGRKTRGVNEVTEVNDRKERVMRAWAEMVQVEAALKASLRLQGTKATTKARSAKTTARMFGSAGDVLQWGREECWLGGRS